MIAVSLLAVSALYAAGVSRLWKSAGLGRGVRIGEMVSFTAGWATLVVAFESPLHDWSETLFVAHMVQHELLMVIAAPLIALGAPVLAIVWAFPRAWRPGWSVAAHWTRRSRLPSRLSAPGVVFCFHAIALWIWHIPALYTAALESDAIHAAQHVSFFATATLFWWTVLRGEYRRGSFGASALYVFGTAMQSGALGALLAFSTRLWYPAYQGHEGPWKLTAVEDQQLAGLVMWLPASVIFTAAGLYFFARWMIESQRRTGRYDRLPTADRRRPV